MPQAPAPAEPPKKQKGPATHEQKAKRRKLIRRIIALVVAAAVIVTSVILLRKFVFKDDSAQKGAPMTALVMRGMIQSKVEGSGTARAKDSAVVTPESGYTVLQLLVSEGDHVEAGQLLYNLDDAAAQDAVQAANDNVRKAQESVRTAQEGVQTAKEGVLNAQENVRKAQESVAGYDKELQNARKSLSELTITAPHAGKLLEVNRDLKAGKALSKGTEIAKVFNDTKLRLRLYYSWAYEKQIQPGQSARISLPGAMADYPGSVEQVNYVRRIVPEGSVTFEVVFVMDNPGTLTEGMAASAQLTAADGTAIYPYEGGKLEYYETTTITAQADGPIEYVSLMDYAAVTPGQVLLRQGDEDVQEDIVAKENALREAQKSVDDAVKGVEDAQKNVTSAEEGVTTAQKGVEEAQKGVEEAQKKLENYHATAPIAGTVLSLGGLVSGEPVPSGAGIQIADTSTMVVDINIDEMNIGYVKTGMFVDLQDQMGNYYMGTIETVALSAKAENGVAVFPATVVVDNPEDMLKTNSYINYSFIASQSDNCLTVPLQAVINVSLSDGMGGGDMIDPGMMEPGVVPADDGVIPEGGGEPIVDGTVPEGGEPIVDGTVPDDGTVPTDDGTVPADDDTVPEGGEPAVDGMVPVDGTEPIVGGTVNVLPAGDVQIVDQPVARAVAVSIARPGFSSSQGAGAFGNSGTTTVCYVKGEPDERAIEADPAWEVPEGFFPVVVTTGLSDEANVEIKSGLNEGDEVFIGYETDTAYAGW